MRRLTSAATILAIFGALFGAGPRQALACSCAAIQPDEAFVRQLLDYADLAVIGNFVAVGDDAQNPPGLTRADVLVERSYGEKAPGEVMIVADDGGGGCGYGASLRQGGRHFMMLTEREERPDTYYASYCSSFPMAQADAPRDDYEEGFAPFLETLARIAPPIEVDFQPGDPTVLLTTTTTAPADVRGGESIAVIAAYVVGSLIALGALVTAASVYGRRAGRT
jgi:hypothetical protein